MCNFDSLFGIDITWDGKADLLDDLLILDMEDRVNKCGIYSEDESENFDSFGNDDYWNMKG